MVRSELGRELRAPLRRLVGVDDRGCAFYVALAREADGPLVELGIGNGRVGIPVALATGRPVFGIDSSPAMLQQAAERPRQAWSSICARATCAILRSTSLQP